MVRAFQAWQIAADWPPEVRLGGRTTELRHRSRELDEAFAAQHLVQAETPLQQDAMFTALVQAEKIAAQHQSALIRVVADGGLWISVQALGPAYQTRHPGAADPLGARPRNRLRRDLDRSGRTGKQRAAGSRRPRRTAGSGDQIAWAGPQPNSLRDRRACRTFPATDLDDRGVACAQHGPVIRPSALGRHASRPA